MLNVVALISGSGTLLQALIDADVANVRIRAVGSDSSDAPGLQRAAAATIETFVVDPRSFDDRDAWNAALLERLASYEPDLVISAGFMRILGADVVEAFAGRMINTHPALLPSFPGAHAVRDALSYGVKVTGCTVHEIDAGVDTGRIIAQQAVAIEPGETEEELHERIKVVERAMLVEVVREIASRKAQP